MATYKVIQDIEAEDKFLGPLTLRQFVFGAIGIFFGYLNVFAITKNFPLAMIIFTPPMLLGFFLAIPWSKDQPTEIWMLAKLRFKVKPRKRIWDQSGMEELVTITVPKVEEKRLTNDISQGEVKSRLEVLAQTIDSRGWAVKHAELNQALGTNMSAERLVSPSSLPQEVPTIDISNMPDVFDPNNATASNLDRMMQQSSDMRMQQNLDKMQRARNGEPLNTISEPTVHFTPPSVSSQQTVDNSVDEAALAAELKAHKTPDVVRTSNMRVIEPINPYAVTPIAPPVVMDDVVAPKSQTSNDDNNQAQAPIPTPVDAAIMGYVNNNDLDLATISRQANKQTKEDDGEVVISLR